MKTHLSLLLVVIICSRKSLEGTLSPEADVSVSTMTSITTEASNDTLLSTEGNNTRDAVQNATDPPKPARPHPLAIIHKGTISKKQYDISNLVINVIMTPVVCVAGVVMNVIGVCVLIKKQFRRSTYIYLCALALSDICALLCCLIRIIPRIAIFYDDVIANRIEIYTFVYSNLFVGSIFTRISEYIICILAVERFLAVLLPLKVKELFLTRHAFPVCIGVSIFCILTHIHYVLVYYPKAYFDPARNVTMYAMGENSWFNDLGIKDVIGPIYLILFLYVPLVVLVTCNIGIVIKVFQMKRKRRTMTANIVQMGAYEQKMTLTLMVISLTFLSVFIPIFILTEIRKVNKDMRMFGREHYLLNLLLDVLTLGWNINSANDFIVYIYTSKQFKESVILMLCGNKEKRKSFPKLDPERPANIGSGRTTKPEGIENPACTLKEE